MSNLLAQAIDPWGRYHDARDPAQSLVMRV